MNAQILSLEEHGSECALVLAGGARSSAFDHNINILRGSVYVLEIDVITGQDYRTHTANHF